jgi:hypothetical protein
MLLEPWYITTDGCMLALTMVSYGGGCLRRYRSGCSGQENEDSTRIHNDNHYRRLEHQQPQPNLADG